METQKKATPKLYHIEAMSEDHIFIGTDLRATNQQDAVNLMKIMFGSKMTENTLFFLISENTIH